MSRKECGTNDAVLPDSLAHGKENRILTGPPPFVVKMSTPQSSPEEKFKAAAQDCRFSLSIFRIPAAAGLLQACKMVAGEKEGSHAIGPATRMVTMGLFFCVLCL